MALVPILGPLYHISFDASQVPTMAANSKWISRGTGKEIKTEKLQK